MNHNVIAINWDPTSDPYQAREAWAIGRVMAEDAERAGEGYICHAVRGHDLAYHPYRHPDGHIVVRQRDPLLWARP